MPSSWRSTPRRLDPGARSATEPLAAPVDAAQPQVHRSQRLEPPRQAQGTSSPYRCQYAYKRGFSAAEAAGHPKVLGIKEDILLHAIRGLANRVFGPERLRLARETVAGGSEDGGAAERRRLEAEREEIEAAMRRQALRLAWAGSRSSSSRHGPIGRTASGWVCLLDPARAQEARLHGAGQRIPFKVGITTFGVV